MLPDYKNIFEIYIENGCKFSFYVHRSSWANGRFAKVVAIDGVIDGQPIEGAPPYFTRRYPENHFKAGKVWKRIVYLEADWFEDDTYQTDCGGNYSWLMVKKRG